MQIELLSTSGDCSGAASPAGTYDVVGPAGPGAFQFVNVPLGQILTVQWNDPVWHIQFQQSAAVSWYVIDVDLSWDAGEQAWKADASRVGGPTGTCEQFLRFTWRPFARMAEQVVRNRIDELTDAQDEVWRWNLEDADLPGHTTRLVHNGGQLWLTDRMRGLTRKWGSQTVPFVSDVFTWWTA